MASVGSPALTMMMAVRGLTRLSTNSSRVFAREEFAFVAVFVHELFGTAVRAVEHCHLVAVVCEVTCEATAHCGKTDYADVCFS